MGEVIHLFTRESVEALAVKTIGDPDAIFPFLDAHFADFQTTVNAMSEATTVDELRAYMQQVKATVNSWPDL